MIFSSMVFIWIFLPVVLCGNFLFKSNKIKNIFLLVCSLIFYAWGGVYYLAIMLSSILINYIGGLVLGKRRDKSRLAFFVVLNLLILIYFKYFNMIVAVVENIIAHNGLKCILNLQRTGSLGIKEVVLPIGISFFTFQSMSYIIDVYREKATVQKNIIDFALYVSLFPQLIAGPIVKYSDVESQLKDRKQSLELTYSGFRKFVYGLGKKVLLANTLGAVADSIWALNLSQLGSALAWIGTLSYTLQIYYDFSGYSDMAIGIGRMLGFEFCENFNYPYTATSVTDFWRRWHMSLTSWFREYVYIPLGGNRKGSARTYLNIFIVFLLTGIWHGANFTFIVWGVYFALIQMIERAFFGEWFKKNPIINWAYTLFVVMIGWILFRSNSISDAITYITQLFSGKSTDYSIYTFLSGGAVVALVIGFIFSGIFQRFIFPRGKEIKSFFAQCVEGVFLLGVLIISISSLVSGTYNPFIYFQF